jgi:hypothetical protein
MNSRSGMKQIQKETKAISEAKLPPELQSPEDPTQNN